MARESRAKLAACIPTLSSVLSSSRPPGEPPSRVDRWVALALLCPEAGEGAQRLEAEEMPFLNTEQHTDQCIKAKGAKLSERCKTEN